MIRKLMIAAIPAAVLVAVVSTTASNASAKSVALESLSPVANAAVVNILNDGESEAVAVRHGGGHRGHRGGFRGHRGHRGGFRGYRGHRGGFHGHHNGHYDGWWNYPSDYWSY